MAQTKLGILIETMYKGKGAKDATRDLKGLDKAAEGSNKTLAQAKAGLAQMAVAAGTVGAALYTAKKAFDFAQEGAKLNQLESSFDLMNKEVFKTPGLLNEMRTAVRGTITDTTLMSGLMTLTAGTSRELGSALAAAAPKLLEIAKASNKLNPELGDTAFLYESISKGIKRASPLILDNLGIVVKVEAANQKLADALGKTVSELTAEEKQMALLNEVMLAGDRLIEQVGGNVDSAADKYANLTTQISNFVNQAKQATAWYAEAIPAIRGADQATLDLNQAIFDLGVGLKEGKIAYEDFIRVQSLAAGGADEAAEEAEKLLKVLELIASAERSDVLLAQRALNYEFGELANVANDADFSLRRYGETVDEATAATEELTDVSAKYFDGTKEGILSQEILNQDIVDAAIAAGGTAQQVAILGGAIGLYSDEAVEAAIQTAIITAAVDDLAQQYVAGTITADGMRSKVNELRRELEAVQGDYKARLDIKVTGLSALQEAKRLLGGGTSFDVPFQDRPGNDADRVPAPAPTPSPFGGGAQHGANFIVPSGYPNDTFPLRVTSGEHVQVTPAGATNNNQTVNIYTGADEAAIMRALDRAGIKANARRRAM